MAAGLRDAGFTGDIKLLGAERELPYERPHLSKGYLLGTVARERLALRPAPQYRDLAVDLMLGERAAEIDVEQRIVRLAGGLSVQWDVLCLATGSDARRLESVPDALYLRELPEANRLRDWIDRGRSLAIAGAGFIGCEAASAARQKGCDVRVFEALGQPLLRVLGPELGAYLAAVHRGHGVDLRLDAPAPARADLVAVGSVPRTQLGERAALQCDNGIVVDELGRTSAPGVFAAGDVTRFLSPLYEQHVRVEHFQTAQRQGFAVGRTMAGAATAYSEVPWFWSDQYDLNLQYAGAGLPWERIVVRGELGRPPFTVFYLAGDRLLGAAGVNDHHTVARARHLMERRRAVTDQQLADPSFDLRRALP